MAVGVMATTAPTASWSDFERRTVTRPLLSGARSMSAHLRAAASDTRRPASARRLHSAMSSTPRRAAAAGDSVHARRVPSAGTRRAVRAVARIAPSSASASPGACRWGCARSLASRVIVALTAPPDRTGEGCPAAWWMAEMPATSARAVAIERPACTTRLSTNALTSAELAGMAGTPSVAAQRVHAVHARRYVRNVFRDQAAVRSSAASAASSPRAARVMRPAACSASTPAGRDGSSRRDRLRLSASAVIRAPEPAGCGGHLPSPLVVGPIARIIRARG